MTDTLQPFRDARQRLRDRAAHHARMARVHETKANGAEHQNWYQLYRTEASNHYAQYKACRWASSSIFHALKDAEKEMRKHDTVAKLRAMA